MIRIIYYRLTSDAEWTEGAVHHVSATGVVVENLKSGELLLVPVQPGLLKFKITSEQWVQMQVAAQREAQSRSVMAGNIVDPSIARVIR
jgi:hypothetical protein